VAAECDEREETLRTPRDRDVAIPVEQPEAAQECDPKALVRWSR